MPESDAAPTPPLTGLRVKRPRVQTCRIDRSQLTKKLGLLRPAERPEDQQVPPATTEPVKRRRKRDFFLSLFKGSDSNLYKRKVVVPSPTSTVVKVPVKLPIPYRDGEHLGVLVSGARVPFSRAMHLTRRAMLMLEIGVDNTIPEDRELLQDFPDRLLRRDSLVSLPEAGGTVEETAGRDSECVE
jgi:hypothetical protein